MLHFQEDNSFIHLENMKTLARVFIFCLHSLRHYSALLSSSMCRQSSVELRFKQASMINAKCTVKKTKMLRDIKLEAEHLCS